MSELDKNYTKPQDPNHVDEPNDWLYSSLVFCRTLGLLLQDKEGVVVDMKGDMLSLRDVKKVIVHSRDNQMVIDECTDDIPEGTLVWMHSEDDE